MSEHSEQTPQQPLEVRIRDVEQGLEESEKNLAQYLEEVARATRVLEEEQAHKAALEQQLSELRTALAEAEAQAQPPAGALEPQEQEEALRRNSELLRDSDLFDAEWYLATYPDVRADEGFAQAPHEHYLRHGGFEGRNPCPEFESAYYLEQYPDVAEAGMNPLVHYLLHGRQEGRRIFPPLEGA